jgi:hypothetical protein
MAILSAFNEQLLFVCPFLTMTISIGFHRCSVKRCPKIHFESRVFQNEIFVTICKSWHRGTVMRSPLNQSQVRRFVVTESPVGSPSTLVLGRDVLSKKRLAVFVTFLDKRRASFGETPAWSKRPFILFGHLGYVDA